jgi:hypothetical protein
VYNEVADGILQAQLNVPYSQLLGQDSGKVSYTALTPGQALEQQEQDLRSPAPSGMYQLQSRLFYGALNQSNQL